MYIVCVCVCVCVYELYELEGPCNCVCIFCIFYILCFIFFATFHVLFQIWLVYSICECDVACFLPCRTAA
jgi:hypothetical protein